jgi:hypothetical protein
MRRNVLSLLILISSCLISGCGAFGQRNYPNDPLLMSKKPILGRAQDARPVQLASAEPVAPLGPAVALASAPRTMRPIATSIDLRPGIDTQDSPPPPSPPTADAGTSPLNNSVSTFKTVDRRGDQSAMPAIPALRIKEAPSVPAVTAVERRVSGNYGNAADYSWLQGVVDKHYQGHLYLRYCDHSVEDTWGGKVCLQDDPRLAQLKDGDVIRVEGEIVSERDPMSRGAWHHYPHYQIRDLKVISK